MWNILAEFCARHKNVNGKSPTADEMCAYLDTMRIADLRKAMFKTDTEVLVYIETRRNKESADMHETKTRDVDDSCEEKIQSDLDSCVPFGEFDDMDYVHLY